jgi:Fur family transcriptional regulator, zinc uptake regulator
MVQDSIQILRSGGYKVTRARRQVLVVLDEAQKPLSAYEIQKLLKQEDKYLNHVTIYRILDLLCHLNLAHRILSTGGYVKCGLGKQPGCHRFLVCRKCGAIIEFASEELCREENDFAGNFGFHTEYHLSEFSGLCASCYEKELVESRLAIKGNNNKGKC